MRKIITFIVVLVIMFPCFSANHPNKDVKVTEQKISGYVDDITYLVVSPYMYSDIDDGKGINLDYTDETNSINRYLIAPTNERLTVPGLIIGSFSFLATLVDGQTARLTISHDKMVNTSSSSAIDWELGVKYSLNDGNTIIDVPSRMCLSSDSTLTYNSAQKSINIDLSSRYGVVSIQDAFMYFRLAEAPTEQGMYESTVTFNLEVL